VLKVKGKLRRIYFEIHYIVFSKVNRIWMFEINFGFSKNVIDNGLKLQWNTESDWWGGSSPKIQKKYT